MWFCKVCSFVFMCLLFSMNCNHVGSNKRNDNIYLKNDNIQGNHNSRFLELTMFGTATKDSKERINLERQQRLQELQLDGVLVIIRNISNEKGVQTNISYRGFERSNQLRNRKDTAENQQHQLVPVDSIKKKTLTREGLTILNSIEREKANIDHMTPNTLRAAASVACLALAIRKCFEALHDVNRTVCKRRYKCKTKFRSYFRKKSKESCLKEFDYTRGNNDTNKKMLAMKYRGKFVDATREGYLRACMPYMVPNYKARSKSTTVRNGTAVNNIAKRMLRSMSEKKCQDLSRAKCVKACNFAYSETCSKYSCSRRKWKAFRIGCIEQCKKTYKPYESDSSSSSSE